MFRKGKVFCWYAICDLITNYEIAMFPKQGKCLELPIVIGMSQPVRMTNEVNRAIPYNNKKQ